MTAKKLPAIQFYPGDWFKDAGIRSLTFEERGIWIELLFTMFESEDRGKLMLNGSAMSDEMVGKILGIHGNKWKKIKRKLEVTGVASIDEKTGCLYNRRMVRDEEIRRKHNDCSKLGGNPNFVKGQPNPYYKDNQIDNQTDNQKITPSSSSSSSSSDKEEGGEIPAPPDHKIKPEELRVRWNQIQGVKLCKTIGGALETKLKRLCKEHDRPWWEALFVEVAKSPFLTGRTAGRDGQAPFRANLDWVTGPINLGKILAGNYDDGGGQPARTPVAGNCGRSVQRGGFFQPCGVAAVKMNGTQPLCQEHADEWEKRKCQK